MTGFSAEWDGAYAISAASAPAWPFSDLVRLMHRHGSRLAPGSVVLELGFGAGANIPFLVSLGFEYWGIEGSEHAVVEARSRFPDIGERLIVGDFTAPLTELTIDAVIDRSSMTHNSSADISRALSALRAIMQPGGLYFGVDWFSTTHTDAKRGRAIDDWTRTDIESGQFTNLGSVHFSDEPHLLGLFSAAGFSIDILELKTRQGFMPATGRLASWDLVAVAR